MSKKEQVMKYFHLDSDWALVVEAVFHEGSYDHEVAVSIYNELCGGALPEVVENFINAKYESIQQEVPWVSQM